MKYIIYARKSTEEDDRQVLSIESQISELKEFAAKEKLEIVKSCGEAAICWTGSSPPQAAKCVRTIFRIEHIKQRDGEAVFLFYVLYERENRPAFNGIAVPAILGQGKL